MAPDPSDAERLLGLWRTALEAEREQLAEIDVAIAERRAELEEAPRRCATRFGETPRGANFACVNSRHSSTTRSDRGERADPNGIYCEATRRKVACPIQGSGRPMACAATLLAEDRRGVQAFLDTIVGQVVTGTYVVPERGKVTVGEWSDKWIVER